MSPGLAQIVGMGAVTPAGTTLEATYKGLLTGKSFASVFESGTADVQYPVCTVEGNEWEAGLSSAYRRRLDRIVRLAMVASDEAAASALRVVESVAPERRGLVAGIGFGGISTLTHEAARLESSGPRSLSPFGVPTAMPSAVAAFVSLRHHVAGPVLTVSNACASGTQALIDGARIIESSLADLVFVCGAEAPLDFLPLASFSRMNAMSKNSDASRACRPFDSNRNGFVLGEGSGCFILASSSAVDNARAASQGAIVGWAFNCDNYHISAPDPTSHSAERCIVGALDNSPIEAQDIGHVNAHGTGTVANDLSEGRAISNVFGKHAVPVTSLKGAIGHLMGAGGVVEAAVSTVAARRGRLPPTVNCENVDPAIDLDVVSDAPRNLGKRPFVSCSFGFGGLNSTVVIAPTAEP